MYDTRDRKIFAHVFLSSRLFANCMCLCCVAITMKRTTKCNKARQQCQATKRPNSYTPDIDVENNITMDIETFENVNEIVCSPSKYIDNNEFDQFLNSKTLMACLRQVLRSMLLVGTTYTVVPHGFGFVCTKIMLAASQVMNVYYIRLRAIICSKD